MHKLPALRLTTRVTVVALSVSVIGACSLLPFMPDRQATAPILDGFGSSTLLPSRANLAAQKLFAQGMGQVYGFNNEEAIRSFKAALAQDAECAMCAWGVAYQMGPNINNPERGDLTEAKHYVNYALQHSAGVSARDQALIESLALRYGHDSVKREIAPLVGAICSTAGSGVERANPLDVAYAERMLSLVEKYPDDADLVAIYAEAEMVATTGDWWDRAGQPGGRIGQVADRLEAALKKHPQHTGLNHYMIHSVDAIQVAHRAESAADRLGQLAPKSPHLLHMPSHTYAQLGRYADATRVNQLAVAADEAMMTELKRQNFSISRDWRGHNRHFQWYGALMEGRGDLALETARAAAKAAQGDHLYFEYTRSLPVLTLLALGRWDELEKEALPTGSKGMASVLGEMAQGIAHVRKGRIEQAKSALSRLEPAVEALLKKNQGTGYIPKIVQSLSNTARFQLRAEIAMATQQANQALSLQTQAANASYDADATEPPMLAGISRRRLGAMQMQARRFADAEQSFRVDLKERPHNGWSLQGLTVALSAQGKQIELPAVQKELDVSWKLADANLRSQY